MVSVPLMRWHRWPASSQRGEHQHQQPQQGSPRQDGLGVLERFASLRDAGKAAMRQRPWT